MEGFKPYEGNEPYIFVSYAHANDADVQEIISDMHRRGYRIWYDEGIEVGSEWQECIASHLAGAHLMIAFISNAYMRSDNCRREMHYALSKRIKTICVFLESTEMSPGMEMQIGNIFALMKYSMTESYFYDRLYSAPLLNSEAFASGKREEEPEKKKTPRRQKRPKPPEAAEGKKKRRKIRRIVALSLFVLIFAAVLTLGIIAYSTGFLERMLIQMEISQAEELPGDTLAQFKSALLEQAAREYTGIEQGEIYVSDLGGLTRLYVIGSCIWFEDPSEELMLSSAYDETLAQGTVDTLSDLAYFTGLETLWLRNQPLNSLESMPAGSIEYLDISGCKVTSLQGIGQLPMLRELTTDGCPIRDLGDINHCLKLNKISLRDSYVSDFTVMKPLTKLKEFAVSNCALDELGTVLSISALDNVSFYNCDLRGRFFKDFDRERRISSLTLIDCRLDSTDNLDDFTGLSTLYLENSGPDLDWISLAQLPALKKVFTDAGMALTLSQVLEGTQVELTVVDG